MYMFIENTIDRKVFVVKFLFVDDLSRQKLNTRNILCILVDTMIVTYIRVYVTKI